MVADPTGSGGRRSSRRSTEIEPCVDGFLDWILTERGLAENTIIAYQRDIEVFAEYLREKGFSIISEITSTQIVSFLRNLTHLGLSAKSIARKLTTIRIFFRYLLLESILEEDPTEGVEMPKLPKPLPDIISVEQVSRIIDGVDLTLAKGLGIRDRAILETLYATGARESEVINMKKQDIYEDIGFVRIFGKGSKERLVPINRTALHWISRYMRDVRPGLMSKRITPVIFLTNRGNPLSRMGLYNIVRRWSEKAGLENVHPHTFRHAFATHLVEGGAGLRAVQEMLGHADISSTQIYTNVSRKYLHDAYEKFHPRGARIN
ncbi:MAG TPA: site-specific tyrosine recombinase XerD [candidate division Zixibacteria bacterium]|nr:site-specific tyrosine recombinase XerD [candidate division Zixibacteria bacterium]